MQPAPGRTRRLVERLLGFVGRELCSACGLPRGADDAKVAPRQASGREEMVLEEPQGNPPDPRSEGDETLQGSKSGFVPDTAPDSTVLVRGGQTPSKRSKPSEPTTFVQPEAPDNLLEVLEGATIDEEHRTVMSTLIQRVQSA